MTQLEFVESIEAKAQALAKAALDYACAMRRKDLYTRHGRPDIAEEQIERTGNIFTQAYQKMHE